MKKMLACSFLSLSLLFSSCLGSFGAFNNLKDWNQNVSNSKFVNNLIFWGLNIIPVYGIFFVGDAVIFNVIEFWSGSNPIAMEEGDSEMQIVEHDGNTIRMLATKNRLEIKVLQGPKKGEKLDLLYKPHEKSWNAIRPSGEIIKLSSFEDGFYLVHTPDGEGIKIDPMQTKEEGLALVKEHALCFDQNSRVAKAY
ncbi:DUF3332 domain-containing protein [Arenibacter aquaticus]|uniref:DUF3332 domain-containing protein n=1 Tax=Arenibacter aquaticus TaxID=2489054 RepID=A0A3S0C8L7_9FLAO|nr:DUF3332 domain-containing protein [Arenibacter aquaticus]RTE54528.1 DUF3332 domain-containing protein [Arenibacter aquaticus]